MKEREGEYCFLVGTQNVGKTDLIRDLMEANARNLVVPASRAEDSYSDIEEIDWREIWTAATNTLHYEAPSIMRSEKSEAIKLKIRFAYELGCELAAFEGKRKIFIDPDTRYIFEAIVSLDFGFKNGGLFFDDYKNYIPSNNLPAYVPNLVTNRRTSRLDLYFACHSVANIAPKFFDYNPSLILFYTTTDLDPTDRRMSKRLFNRVQEAKTEVDRISLEGQKEGDPSKRCTCRIIHAKDYQ